MRQYRHRDDAASDRPDDPAGETERRHEPLKERALPGLVRLQCRIGRAAAAAVLVGEGEALRVIATVPSGGEGPGIAWGKVVAPHLPDLSPLGGSKVIELESQSSGLYGVADRRHLILMDAGQDPVAGRRVEAFLVETADQRELDHRRQLLEFSRALLDLHAAQSAAAREAERARRLAQLIEELDTFQREGRFRGAAMALCNEMCSRLGAERVSVGFLSGRYVKVRAMSQTEHLNRRMQLVQDIESAMEECLDQDVEVVRPAGPEMPVVSRAAAELAKKHGSGAGGVVLTLPLRDRQGNPVAAVTIERDPEKPFTEEQIKAVRLLCNLVTPRLLELYDNDRWFGARWVTSARKQAATVLGPEHTWVKVAAVVLVAITAFLVFARGTDWVEGTFVVEPVVARSVPAPWNGYLQSVEVEPGDVVEAGVTPLGALDTAELRMELAQAKADQGRALTEADLAWRENKQAERLIAQAKAQQAAAQVQLLEHRLSQATILAPLTGIVTQGDLKKELGRPVEKGQVLFEVAPLDALRAVVMVPEGRIFDVWEGQRGQLATASHPGEKLPFVVEHIHPVAEVVDQKNVFKVRVRLDGPDGAGSKVDWLRPGVEGVAKADAGEARYAWIWTRDAINWVRMKLWW